MGAGDIFLRIQNLFLFPLKLPSKIHYGLYISNQFLQKRKKAQKILLTKAPQLYQFENKSSLRLAEPGRKKIRSLSLKFEILFFAYWQMVP